MQYSETCVFSSMQTKQCKLFGFSRCYETVYTAFVHIFHLEVRSNAPTLTQNSKIHTATRKQPENTHTTQISVPNRYSVVCHTFLARQCCIIHLQCVFLVPLSEEIKIFDIANFSIFNTHCGSTQLNNSSERRTWLITVRK